MVEANVLAKEAVRHEQLGIVIQPIPLEHLRVGTVSDASCGNVRPESNEETQDFWEEKGKVLDPTSPSTPATPISSSWSTTWT